MAIILPDIRNWLGSVTDRIIAHLAMSEVNYRWEETAWFETVTYNDYGKTIAPSTSEESLPPQLAIA